MTPDQQAALVTAVGIAAGAVAAGAAVRQLRMPARRALTAAAIAVAAGLVLTVAGLRTEVADAPYLLDLAAFAAPVVAALVALTGSAVAAAVWGLVVLPIAAIAPLALTAGCAGTGCALQDFGGSLPLVVSSAGFLIAVGVRVSPPAPRLLPSVVIAAAGVVWIATMEGAIDAYLPRLILTGAIVPIAAALAWTVVDALSRRASRRSPVLGLLAGVVAMIPGAAVLGWPWAIVLGAVAGAAGSAVAGRWRRSPRLAPAALVVGLVGLVAPALVGDEVGIIITADAVTVGVALALAAGVIVLGVAAGLVVRAAMAWAGRRPS